MSPSTLKSAAVPRVEKNKICNPALLVPSEQRIEITARGRDERRALAQKSSDYRKRNGDTSNQKKTRTNAPAMPWVASKPSRTVHVKWKEKNAGRPCNRQASPLPQHSLQRPLGIIRGAEVPAWVSSRTTAAQHGGKTTLAPRAGNPARDVQKDHLLPQKRLKRAVHPGSKISNSARYACTFMVPS